MHRTNPTSPYGSTGSGSSEGRSGEICNLSSRDESPPGSTSNGVRPQQSESDERTGYQHRKSEGLRPFHAQPLPFDTTGSHGSYQANSSYRNAPPSAIDDRPPPVSATSRISSLNRHRLEHNDFRGAATVPPTPNNNDRVLPTQFHATAPPRYVRQPGYPQWTTTPPVTEAPLDYPYTTTVLVSAGVDGGGDGDGATSRPTTQSQAHFPLQLLAPQQRRPRGPHRSPPGSPHGSPPGSTPGSPRGSPRGLPLGPNPRYASRQWRWWITGQEEERQEETHRQGKEANRWTMQWPAWAWRYGALALLCTPSFLYTLHRLFKFVKKSSMV